jgi:hypothetical protein
MSYHPNMPRRCSVCAHEQRADIDSALVRGVPYRRVATQHGVSEQSVRRHIQHASDIKVAANETAEKHQRSVLERVRELSGLLEEQLEAVASVSPPDDALGITKELSRLLELEAKLTGELAPKKVEQTVTHVQTAREALDFFKRVTPMLEEQAAEEMQ